MELLQAAHLRAVHRMLHMQFNTFVLLLALCKYADYDNQLATVLRNVLALAMPGGTGPISGNEIFLKRKAVGKQDLFLFHWQVLPVQVRPVQVRPVQWPVAWRRLPAHCPIRPL